MPARTKKSKAALQREDKKKSDTVKEMPSTSQNNLLQNKEKIASRSVIAGTLHQGDVRFQYPGVQCTYISFWALLLMENKEPLLWNADDVDSCIIDGNARFLEHCFKNNIHPRQLLVKELPELMKVSDCLITLHQLDSDIKVGTLDQNISANESNSIFSTMEGAILRCFDLFSSCFLVCGGQTIAIAKRQNMFFVFDSHSRGKDGLLHHAGSAVLLSFIDIQVLISFIKQLFLESLCMKVSEQFELVPVTISKQSNSNEMRCEAVSCIMNIGLNTESRTSYKDLNIPSVNDQANTVLSVNSSSPPKHQITSSHERGMHSYFDDKQKCTTECRETKSQNNKSDFSKHAARKEYMRGYMSMRRNDDSFRKQSNVLSLKSMNKLLCTEEGRQRHNEQAAGSRQNIVSTEEGRKMYNKQCAYRMKKLTSSEEGRQKQKDRNAERMKRILSTEEGKQKHRTRSAEGMKKMLSTEEGRQKHRKRSAEGMTKILSTEEGRQKHRKRSAERMTKILSTEEGRQKHRKQSAEGMTKIHSTETGRKKHKKRSAEGMKKIRETEAGSQYNRIKASNAIRKLRANEEYLLYANNRESNRKRKLRECEEF